MLVDCGEEQRMGVLWIL